MKAMLAPMLMALLAISACTKVSADTDPRAIEQKYGLSGGYVDQIDTEEGKVAATVIPTTLDDGRKVRRLRVLQSARRNVCGHLVPNDIFEDASSDGISGGNVQR